MARPSGSAKILLSLKSSDVSLMVCLITKVDSGVKKKTDEFKKISFLIHTSSKLGC